MGDARYLVTGGAGFIGAHLVGALLARGATVCALDDLSSGSWTALGADRDAAALRCVEGDVRDAALCAELARGVDVVFHEAAICSVQESIEAPVRVDATNVGGTVAVLDAARHAHVRRVVLASSTAVYGDAATLPVHEGLPTEPLSPYAAGKLAAEHYARVFCRLGGSDAACLRYFNVFGPGQTPDSAYAAAIPRFIAAALAGETLTIYGDGEQTRDFCYVDDVVEANLRAADVEVPLGGRAINVGTGASVPIARVAEHIRGAVGGTAGIVHAPARAGDVRHSRADIGLARRLLGFEPHTRWQDGIAPTVAYLRAYRDARPGGAA
ncbi:MAG: NAD-dependent epimerase/dehydratase family protein [Myxococcales bacterium]|nr:NAD-dependent epimerase/dehydratase family protein [Myxococcales bacterium]